MGKMKAYMMDNAFIAILEEQFIDKCADVAIDSESFQEYTNRVNAYLNMVPHLNGQEISDIIEDVYFDMNVQLGGN